MAITIVGTDGDDVIDRNFPANRVPDSSETIRGLGGRDTIDGYGGNDVIEGGAGNDRIDGGAGNDRLDGGDGDDIILGGAGDNILIGGAGNDVLQAGFGLDDSFSGGDGDDTIIVTEFTRGPIDGGAGYDVIKARGIELTDVRGVERLEFSSFLVTSVEQFYSFESIVSTSPYEYTSIDLTSAGTIDFAGRFTNTKLSIVGSDAGNTIYGGELDDAISGGGFKASGGGRIVAFGRGGNDSIRDSGANDELHGGTGDDNLASGRGDDVLYGDEGNDRISFGQGADTAYGGAGDDVFSQDASVMPNGYYGEHYIDSYSKMYGEEGNDRFFIGSTRGGSLVDGGAGRDKLIVVPQIGEGFTSSMADYDIRNVEILNIRYAVKIKGSQLELFDELDFSQPGGYSNPVSIYLVGGGVADFTSLKITNPAPLTIHASAEGSDIRAGALNASIVGSDADDRIASDAVGAITAAGGRGNDIYVVDARDTVREAAGQGNDAVLAKADYVLADGVSVERLYAYDAGTTYALNLTGNAFDQTIRGNSGNNILDGKGGADTLIGGQGNDTYRVDSAADRVIERAGEGRDTVETSVQYALGAGQEIETLKLVASAESANLNLIGNAGDNRILGGSGHNKLDGGAGDDLLAGKFGNDVLMGRAGRDTFVFDTKPGSGNVDRITDFSHADDTIQLARGVFSALAPGELSASAFKDAGDAGAVIDADDRVIYDHRNGALYYDTNGSGAGGRTLIATLDNKAIIDHSDFLVA